MSTLFLDLSSGTKTIGIIFSHQKTILQCIDDHTDESKIMEILQQLLRENDASLSDLKRIAVTVGPGGFMSIRVGIALSNALSWSLKIPLAGIHLSDLWKMRVTSHKSPAFACGLRTGKQVTNEKTQNFLWLHSTKKESFFIRGFGVYEKQWPEPTLILLKDLLPSLHHQTSYRFVGELLPDQRTALPMLTEMENVRSIEAVLPDLVASLSYEQKTLEPWYGRGA